MQKEITPQWMIDQGFSKTLAKRFWKHAIPADGCWSWNSATASGGYGKIACRGHAKHGLLPAHRLSWMIHFGPIPEGIKVLHECDNPPCTRPDHLFLGTSKDNVADMISKGRGNWAKKLTPEDVRNIRELISRGESNRAIATLFKVHFNNIFLIRKGRIWKTVI